MDIIFIDPGYGKGFSVSSGGSLTSVESEEYNPVNGVAFTGSAGTTAYFYLPSSITSVPSDYFEKHMTFKFSFYCPQQPAHSLTIESPKYGATSSSGYATINLSPNSCTFKLGSTRQTITGNGSATGFHNFAFTVCIGVKNRSNPYRLARHICCEFDGNSAAIALDNQLTYSEFSSYLNILFQNYTFTSPGLSSGDYYISNIIVATLIVISTSSGMEGNSLPLLSSEAFPVPLTLSKPTGDFSSVGGGEYVGNASGQKLLQTIDTSDAVAKFGATSKVSHLVVYGNPGYRVGSNITEAYGISKDGNSSITSHGSCELSTDTDATTCVAWETPDTKLPDLDGLKVGWQI